MFKAISSIALATAVLFAPTLAVADVGLEGGSTAGYSWTGSGTFTAETSLNYVFTAADYGFDAAGAVGPGVGSYFGVATATGEPSDPFTLTYTFSSPTLVVDYLYIGLITADAIAGSFDDSVTVTLSGTAGVYYSEELTASYLNSLTGYYPFTDWIAVEVAAGTTSFSLSLKNAVDNANPPTLVVDYYATPTPVPEAGSTLMALAGLGVVGFVAARRRRV